MKFIKANRIAPDGTPRFAASHLGLFCLPMSRKKGSSLIWVPIILNFKPGERPGLVVRASDSGSGDPCLILGRVGVLFP